MRVNEEFKSRRRYDNPLFRCQKEKQTINRWSVGYSLREDTLSLRLTSKLVDLRSGYANPAPFGAGVRILYSDANEQKSHPFGWLVRWQRNRDSNPNIQSQSLLCYRYTIPLFCACLFYHNNFRLSSLFCSKFYLFVFIVLQSQKSKAFLLDFWCCLCYTYIKLHLCPTNRQVRSTVG